MADTPARSSARMYTEKEPKLKPKDEKDIKEILANTEQLLKQDGLMFDGDPALSLIHISGAPCSEIFLI